MPRLAADEGVRAHREFTVLAAHGGKSGEIDRPKAWKIETMSPRERVCPLGAPESILARGHIAMGSMRTWSLAVLAGIFVAVVAHQGSNADAGASNALPAASSAALPRAGLGHAHPPPPAAASPDCRTSPAWWRRTAPPWSISAWSRSPRNSRGGAGNGGEQGDDDPLSQFFHRFQVPDARSRPSACRRTASDRGSSSRPTATCSPTRTWWRTPPK